MTEKFNYKGKTYRTCNEEELKLISKARNEASKPSNFAILYGGGMGAVAGPIAKTFPNMPENEIKVRANKVLKSKKGVRSRGSTEFKGGSWSGAFNTMRDISFGSVIPELPLLKSKISTALRPSAVGDDFVTGRLNWTIQGSGAEILTALIVMMHWLVNYYGINAYFVLSVHDEIVWMAKEEEAHLMTVIFQQAHFLTWTLFHYQMELYELPLQRAYFSGVAIDNRVRKSPYEKTTTPTNPKGDQEPFGEEFTIEDLIEKGWIDELITKGDSNA